MRILIEHLNRGDRFWDLDREEELLVSERGYMFEDEDEDKKRKENNTKE